LTTDMRELSDRELYEHEGLAYEFDLKRALTAAEYMKYFNLGAPMSEETEIELRIRLQREMVKAAIKEGMKEWLDEKILNFGRWSITAIAAAALVLFAWALLTVRPWEMKIK
jgi:hypothetical protein